METAESGAITILVLFAYDIVAGNPFILLHSHKGVKEGCTRRNNSHDHINTLKVMA